jgi:hypothetical protein
MSEDKRTIAPRSGDPFGLLLGPGRGLSGAVASQQELKDLREKLDAAAASLAEARTAERILRGDIRKLKAEVAKLAEERDTARKLTKFAEGDRRNALVERDRARYTAMRGGAQDPCIDADGPTFHQREWTAGRPYLGYQHAWHPRSGECYRACSTGAPIGEVPGSGRHWERCLDLDGCPLPPPTRADEIDDAPSGPALRRTELVWGREQRRRAPRELSDDELANVIGFLRSNANDMCSEEFLLTDPPVPSPVNAFPTAAAWMADTPLMRALLRERRRRQAAARRKALSKRPAS